MLSGEKKHSSYYKKTVVLHKNCSEAHSESKMKKRHHNILAKCLETEAKWCVKEFSTC